MQVACRYTSADNYLLDAPLAAACAEDADAHCAAVVPGQGRVHECLRANAEKLTPEAGLYKLNSVYP
jgi:hypothetical protein